MSISKAFDHAASSQIYEKDGRPEAAKRASPFSIRFSDKERAFLLAEANGAPLGAYIKAKVLGSAPTVRMRRSGATIEDRKAFAQALALLGASRISSNLNQLAHAANIGALPLTPETEVDLAASVRDVREIRRLLIFALGLKPEAAR